MLDNWERRYGIWNLYKHPNCLTNVGQKSTLPTSSNSHDVVIKFMWDTLELNITLGHQITADTLPNVTTREQILPASSECTEPVKRRTTITSKVLHWTLLKIQFTSPSKLMLRKSKSQTKSDGEDVKLAHFLLLRSLTPSRLAELCPNTKDLEKTLNVISKVSSWHN